MGAIPCSPLCHCKDVLGYKAQEIDGMSHRQLLHLRWKRAGGNKLIIPTPHLLKEFGFNKQCAKAMRGRFETLRTIPWKKFDHHPECFLSIPQDSLEANSRMVRGVSSLVADASGGPISPDELAEILNVSADEELSLQQFAMLLVYPQHFSSNLMSSCILDANKASEMEDMSRPIHDYFIMSSHNSYLTGNQLNSRSNAETIARMLLAGYRVIELDCFEQKGHTTQVIVTHGGTLTSKLFFRDCISTLAQNSFVNSSHPVILTLENHCKSQGCALMAQILHEELGELLYVPPEGEGHPIPSVEQLYRKVVIRGKVSSLRFASDHDVTEESSDVKTGFERSSGLSKSDLSRGSLASFHKLDRLLAIQNVKMDTVEQLLSRSRDGATPSTGSRSLTWSSRQDNLAAAGVPQTLPMYSCSLSEDKCAKNKELIARVVPRATVRVYPTGTRIDSSNFDPKVYWSLGVQIAALNFQTADRPTWINAGKFRANNGCGYVLKPDLIPQRKSSFNFKREKGPDLIQLRIISGHNLPYLGGGDVLDPFVKVAISGCERDEAKQETEFVKNNGFDPMWQHEMSFVVHEPSLAVMLFELYDRDVNFENLTVNQFAGQYALPVTHMRRGYCTVPLLTKLGDQCPLAYLFVHVTINGNDAPHSPILGSEAGENYLLANFLNPVDTTTTTVNKITDLNHNLKVWAGCSPLSGSDSGHFCLDIRSC